MTPTPALTLTIAHLNDTHSYFEPTHLPLTLQTDSGPLHPYVSVGGFARIATRVKQLKKQALQQEQPFLLLHAGDCFQGTLYFTLFKGEANARLLNALNIDAMALGNHELDMGNTPVYHFLNRIKFPMLAGNWDLSREQADKAHPLATQSNLFAYDAAERRAKVKIHDYQGQKVAVFGVSIEKMHDIANPDVDTDFADAVDTARHTVTWLHQQGIRHIVLLSHLGYERDIDLAQQVDGIGLIIGAHTHRLQGDFSELGLGKDDDYGRKVNRTYIVQSGCHAQALGHCQISFDAEGQVVAFAGKNELLLGRSLCIEPSLTESLAEQSYQQAKAILDQHPLTRWCPQDPEIKQLLAEHYQPQVTRWQQHEIARNPSKKRHVRVPDQQGGSEIAPLVAQSFHYAMNDLGYEVDFAIHNAGGTRTDLPAGAITSGDIAGRLLPFSIPVGCYDIDGDNLKALLEGAINNATNNGVQGTGGGSYPYVYGLSFDYHPSASAGQRIANLTIYQNGQWQAVEPQRTYTGSSTLYTMKGKEGYDAILKANNCQASELTMADCFIQFLQIMPNILRDKDNNSAIDAASDTNERECADNAPYAPQKP